MVKNQLFVLFSGIKYGIVFGKCRCNIYVFYMAVATSIAISNYNLEAKYLNSYS